MFININVFLLCLKIQKFNVANEKCITAPIEGLEVFLLHLNFNQFNYVHVRNQCLFIDNNTMDMHQVFRILTLWRLKIVTFTLVKMCGISVIFKRLRFLVC